MPAGRAAVFPAGVVHNWWNAGEDLLEFNGQAIPAVDLDRYLQAVFAILNASASGRPSIFYLAHLCVAAPAHTGGYGASTSHSADRFPSGSPGRPHSGQIPRR